MRGFKLGFICGMLLVPLIAIVIAMSGLWPIHATAEPLTFEARLARRAFNASLSRQAPRLQNPLSPSVEILRAGLQVYRSGCSGCHGDPGKPSHWGSTAFYPRVQQFGHTPPQMPDWQMFWIVKHGIRYTGMGAWEGEVSEDKIWQVATFLSHLRELPPEVQAEWLHPK
jgi:mono/diheme cytochrome c family protein